MAPLLSLTSGVALFMFGVNLFYTIITTVFIAVLSYFVFADHDYSVKLDKINRSVPDIEASQEDKKVSIVKNKIAIEELNESYKRNPFVRINRELY